MTPSNASRPGRGFTLIELLVVIAIIAVLIALLLPAVQAAREAARRCQCVNNLMQLSIALQNYESAHEVLPPGVVNATGPIKDGPPGYHFGWLSQILPYVEQKNVFNHLDHSVGVYADNNQTVRAIGINSFLCPSDGWRGMPVGGNGYAPSNYAGCHNDVEAPIDVKNTGVFYLNSRVSSEDIPDGRSSTIFLGEKALLGADHGWIAGTRSTLRNTGSPINAANGVKVTIPTGEGIDEDAASGAPGTKGASGPVGGFSSHHPGGANFAFGDGSVKFLKNSINPKIYRWLGNRADGEMISDDTY